MGNSDRLIGVRKKGHLPGGVIVEDADHRRAVVPFDAIIEKPRQFGKKLMVCRAEFERGLQ